MVSRREKIVSILSQGGAGRELEVMGWVRSKRGNKRIQFITLNDGSTIENLQIVVDSESFDGELLRCISTGASLIVKGTLVESPGKGQSVELQATHIELLGEADAAEYPLQKKGHTLEFLREIAHLRPRTATFSAILRLRHAMSFAIHEFFNRKGFVYLHTPILTSSDAEGAGAMFSVTTLPLNAIPRTEDGGVNFKEDFFGKHVSLTVSGQLEGELGALALGEIYTFGPTFRAENSNTPRHLAEFWMIEPEMAFYTIQDNMDLAEEFLKYLTQCALERCEKDLAFLNQHWDTSLIERLEKVCASTFARLTYTEAVDILTQSGKKWEYPVSWGVDLQSEHERYLVEEHCKRPVILTDYPADIKAFYMKQNPDGKTVAAMDVLFPTIGEIIGGSEREWDYTKLQRRIKELQIPERDVWWYLQTRQFGSVPHSGFGLGFERLMLFITGMTNIRDVIPFPRTPGHCEF